MARTRTVFVASAASALLLSASAAFAFSSGLFSSGRAEQVGTFQAIEQRLSPASVPATAEPRSPARTLTPPLSASVTSRSPKADADAKPYVRDSDGTPPATTVVPESDAPEPSATSTSRPENRDDELEHELDDGRESDD